MDINYYLKNKQELIEKSLIQYLPSPETPPKTIHQAMHYSVFAGGKRLRPILTLAVGEMFEQNESDILPFACAIELIHTYSLIHDDLPALDNDSMRRGKPTNHVVFGEDIAILAGDSLLNYAYELMTKASLNLSHDNKTGLLAMKEISSAAGITGMIAGQVVDVETEKNNKQADLGTVTFIHKHKTAALISACVRAAARLSQANSKDIENLTTYADNIGLAFQVVDDVLDIEGNEAELGKTTGKDERYDKATYPKFMGVDSSRNYADQLLRNSLEALEEYGESAEPLRQLANKLVNRDK